MKKIILIVMVFIPLMIFSACSQSGDVVSGDTENLDNGQISIVTTIFPPYDFARAVLGNNANLTMLIPPGSEVHSFDPSPADIIKIQEADVFIYIGGESEAWVDSILDSIDTNGKEIIRLMDYIKPLAEETVEGMEEGDHHHDGESGDVTDEEAEYDEHIWTSPQNAIIMINAIADVLSETDPKNADVYKENAANYNGSIQKVDDEIKDIVAKSDYKLLVFGDRFPFRYFTQEFGLDYRAAFNGCSAETEVSAGTLAYLINTVKDNNISYIFYIEMSNLNIAKSISEQTGAGMLLLHSCHNVSKEDFEKGTTYLMLMKQNADNLKKGLN